MRGYFGVGVEGVSKHMNAGSLFRTAHAFGASFLFTIGAAYSRAEGGLADTSDAGGAVPYYEFSGPRDLRVPEGCSLVAVEIAEDAVDLPRFRHPRCAAYVLGPERGHVSGELVELADSVVKIPTRFAINLAIAGAIVMYDRLISTRRFGDRPIMPGAAVEPSPPHVFGEPLWRRRLAERGAREEGRG